MEQVLPADPGLVRVLGSYGRQKRALILSQGVEGPGEGQEQAEGPVLPDELAQPQHEGHQAEVAGRLRQVGGRGQYVHGGGVDAGEDTGAHQLGERLQRRLDGEQLAHLPTERPCVETGEGD